MKLRFSLLLLEFLVALKYLFALLVVFATAPVFLELAMAIAGNLWALLSGRRQADGSGDGVRLAVVVPAHNEELLVARAVASVKAQAPDARVYVVAHNCTDGTAKAAVGAGAEVLVLDDAGLRGKAAALRHGFAGAIASGADACLVLDADSVACEGLLDATRAAFAAGAKATQCRYEQRAVAGQETGSGARLRILAFRGMNVLRARGRAALGFSAGIFGNGFAISAGTLAAVPYTADGIVEDLEYHVRLVAAGGRVTWLDGARVYAELAAGGKVQARQQARWEGGRLAAARQSSGLLVAAVARGRFRAAEALLDLWSLPLSRAVALAVFGILIPEARLYGAACLLVTAGYLAGTIVVGEEPGRDLLALVAAPGFVVRKLVQSGLMIRQAGKDAEWVRTEREQPLR